MFLPYIFATFIFLSGILLALFQSWHNKKRSQNEHLFQLKSLSRRIANGATIGLEIFLVSFTVIGAKDFIHKISLLDISGSIIFISLVLTGLYLIIGFCAFQILDKMEQFS